MSAEERLKRYLEIKCVKQTMLAQRIGMGLKALNAILNGHAKLKVETLEKICAAIDTSPVDFFTYKFQENGS